MKQDSSNAAAKGSLFTARLFLKPSMRILARSRKSPAAGKRRAADDWRDLVGWISRKLEIGEPHALIHDLIRSDICRRFESGSAAVRYVIVLVHAIAAYTQSAD